MRRPPLLVSLLALCIILAFINQAFAPDPLALTNTSYGKHLGGHNAAHDLLDAVGLLAGRTRKRPNDPGQKAQDNQENHKGARWLVVPGFLEPAEHAGATWASAAGDADADALLAWVERGGTAVVFGDATSNWQRIGLELLVMKRADVPDDGGSSVANQEPDGEALVSNLADALDVMTYLRKADAVALTPGPGQPLRHLQLHEPLRFEPLVSDDYRVLQRLGEAPFIVDKAVGAGRIVAVADRHVLDNGTLDLADHSLIAVDLARQYGAVTFDERCHGLLPAGGLLQAVGVPAGTAILASLAILALAVVLRRRAEPPRTLVDDTPYQPQLHEYVDSLAQLYARRGRREVRAAFEAYRTGLRMRLRRQFFGRGRGDDHMLARRIEADLKPGSRVREALEGRLQPSDHRESLELAGQLERYAARIGADSAKTS